MTTITVKDVLDALDKNGFPWAKGRFLNANGASCAMGQVARNLGIDLDPESFMPESAVWSIHDQLCDLMYEDNRNYITIIDFNDSPSTTSLKDVQRYAHEKLDKFADRKIEY